MAVGYVVIKICTFIIKFYLWKAYQTLYGLLLAY